MEENIKLKSPIGNRVVKVLSMKLRCLGSLGSHHVLTSKGSGFEAERQISRSLLLSRRYMRRT